MAVGRVFKRTWKDKDGTFRQSPNYSIAYWFRGRERVESAHTDSETKAKKLLAQRLKEIGKGAYAIQQDRFFTRTWLNL